MAKLTQKAILTTFEAMLREMPFHKITVSALVDRCCISSNTFYYHYRDIYALLDAWLETKQALYPLEDCVWEDWKDQFKRLLRGVQANPDIVNHIYDSIPRQRLRQYVLGTLETATWHLIALKTQDKIGPDQQKMLAGVLCYTMTGFLVKFIAGGMQGSIDETFDPILNFLGDSMEAYVRQEMEKSQ